MAAGFLTIAGALLKAALPGIISGLAAAGIKHSGIGEAFINKLENLFDYNKRVTANTGSETLEKESAGSETLEKESAGSETLEKESAGSETLEKENEMTTVNPPLYPNQDKDQKEQTPIVPLIPDKSNEEEQTGGFDLYNYMQEAEKRQMELTKLQMEREDTAYSRAIQDLKNSGVNPNLLGNIQPAESAAINNMSSMNSAELIQIIQSNMSLLEQEIQNNANLNLGLSQSAINAISTIVGAMIFGITRK